MQITCDFPDNVLAIGTKVYIPRPAVNSVQEDEIAGYYCALLNVDGKPTLIPTDYRLNIINLSRGGLNDGWKSDEFFLSYEEAKANAVMYKVTATPEEWLKAIGLDGSDNEDRTDYDEDCELFACCTLISDIRDILHQLCKDGQIDGITRRNLIALMNAHEPPVIPGGLPANLTYPNLTKILAQLNLVWKEPDTDTDPYVTEIKK
jgi:hypothetical protein